MLVAGTSLPVRGHPSLMACSVLRNSGVLRVPRHTRLCVSKHNCNATTARVVSGPARPRSAARARAAAEPGTATAGAAVTTTEPTSSTVSVDFEPSLLEVNKDTWAEQVIANSANRLIVVDFFTDRCGPCKLIYPQLVTMASELAPTGVSIVKFNCNAANKDLAKAVGIRVAPTFQLYKGGVKVAEMTGAKVDKLRELINEHSTSSA